MTVENEFKRSFAAILHPHTSFSACYHNHNNYYYIHYPITAGIRCQVMAHKLSTVIHFKTRNRIVSFKVNITGVPPFKLEHIRDRDRQDENTAITLRQPIFTSYVTRVRVIL